MEIVSKDVVNGVNCYTVRVFNKLVKVEKVLELIENLDDYFDKDFNLDKESLKEDLLNPRDYVVKVNDPNSITGKSCDCKGYYFKKNCRHINFILENEKI